MTTYRITMQDGHLYVLNLFFLGAAQGYKGPVNPDQEHYIACLVDVTSGGYEIDSDDAIYRRPSLTYGEVASSVLYGLCYSSRPKTDRFKEFLAKHGEEFERRFRPDEDEGYPNIGHLALD